MSFSETMKLGTESFKVFIDFIQVHSCAKSTEVMKRILLCATNRHCFLRIWDLASLDKNNMRHALNIMELVGAYPGDFVAWIDDNFRDQIAAIYDEQLQLMTAEAGVIKSEVRHRKALRQML